MANINSNQQKHQERVAKKSIYLKTQQELEFLFEACEKAIIKNLEDRKLLYNKRKRKKFSRHFYESDAFDDKEFWILYEAHNREVIRLNKLRQALWKYSVYKQLK